MSKHSALKEESKAKKLKKMLPSNYALQLSRMAAEHNKGLEEPEAKLPTNRVTICNIVSNLRTEHPIWPLVEILINQFQTVKKEREARLDEFLKQSA